MKIIILSPNRKGLFTKEMEERLSTGGELIFIEKPFRISEITELSNSEEKILALDPDFVGWKFSKENIDWIQNLKAICLQTTSFGWIDIKHAHSKQIPVTNLRGFSTEAVAEYALLMMLGVSRKLSLVIQDGFKQDFIRHQGTELLGKQVGIVGLGSISRRFGELCHGLGMSVVYWSRSSHDERFSKIELKELFATSNIVFPGLAQNEETKSIIEDDLLLSLKPSASFVSIVHKIYNHDLLLRLVKEEKLYGYAFEEDNGDPTKYEGNVLALPAVAWATNESMRKNGELWTEAILDAAKQVFPTQIN